MLIPILLCFFGALRSSPQPTKERVDATDASLIIYVEIAVGDSLGHACGVYFQHDGSLYFVTAGHVLAELINRPRIHGRFLLCSTGSRERDGSYDRFSLNLSEIDFRNDCRNWSDIDIAVVRLMRPTGEYSRGVKLLERSGSPLVAIDDTGIVSSDSADWPCHVQLWAFPTMQDSTMPSRKDVVRINAQVLAIRRHSATAIMSYRGVNGFSGAPIFAERENGSSRKSLLFAIHTSTIEWDNPADTACTEMVSVGTCADEIFRRIAASW